MVKRNAVAPSYNEALQQARTAIFLAHLEPFLPEERLLDEVVGEDVGPRGSSASCLPPLLRYREYVTKELIHENQIPFHAIRRRAL